MAAPKVDAELADLLADLRGEKPLSAYSGAFPSINPVDIFRCVITEELAKIAELEASFIYPALEWTNTLDKGDLLLAVPRLRVKGSPAEKAASWAAAVSRSIQFPSKAPLSTITVSTEPADQTSCRHWHISALRLQPRNPSKNCPSSYFEAWTPLWPQRHEQSQIVFLSSSRNQKKGRG